MGWLLVVGLVVLVPLAIVDPTRGVYVVLIGVIVLVAILLGMNFPSAQARAMPRGMAGRTDFGRQASEHNEHEPRAD
ncbi:MAG: hypothetical protein WAK93_05825 [Solirubrobacteraceae bacterium]